MVLFKDLNKAAKDSLTKNYCHERHFEVEAKHAGQQGLTLKARVGPHDAFDSSLKLEQKLTEGATLEVNTGVNNASNLQLKYTPPADVADPSKGIFKRSAFTFGALSQRVVKNNSTKDSVEFSAEAMLAGLHARSTFTPQSRQWNVNALYQLPLEKHLSNTKLFVGGEVSGNADKPQRPNIHWGCKAVTKADNFEYTATVRSGSQEGQFIGHLLSKKISKKETQELQLREVSAEVLFSSGDQRHSMSFGGKFDLYDDIIKAKITHDKRLAVAYTRQAVPFANVTFGTEISHDMQARFGLKLDLKS